MNRSLCGEAKAQGMRAVVHLYPADSARKVVLAGCTGVVFREVVA